MQICPFAQIHSHIATHIVALVWHVYKEDFKGLCLWASQRNGCGSQRLLGFEQCRYTLFFVFTLLLTREHFPNVLFLFSVLQLSFDDIVKYAGVYGEGSSALANLQVRAVNLKVVMQRIIEIQ